MLGRVVLGSSALLEDVVPSIVGCGRLGSLLLREIVQLMRKTSTMDVLAPRYTAIASGRRLKVVLEGGRRINEWNREVGKVRGHGTL